MDEDNIDNASAKHAVRASVNTVAGSVGAMKATAALTTPSAFAYNASSFCRHTSAENSDAAQTSSVDVAVSLLHTEAEQRKGNTQSEAKLVAAQTLGQILQEYPVTFVLEPTVVAPVALSDSRQCVSGWGAVTSRMSLMVDEEDEEGEGKKVDRPDNSVRFQPLIVIRDTETGGSNLDEFPSSTNQNSLGTFTEADNRTTPTDSIRSIGSLVCRICHNSENPEKLVSPCLCKGSLSYVHIYCLERWISTSRSTSCELCQFQYNTEQTLRYSCLQSLRMWYSRSMSRRALQEDCQMFSLLTLVAFGIIGTLLVGIQYYFLQSRTWGLGKIWTKGWLVFFLLITMAIYFMNVYMIVRSQLTPWYRWWQSARDIKLILENRRPFKCQSIRTQESQARDEPTVLVSIQQLQQQHQPQQQQQPQTLEQCEQQRETSAPIILPLPRPAVVPVSTVMVAVVDPNVV